jgi:hypothetical protein
MKIRIVTRNIILFALLLTSGCSKPSRESTDTDSNRQPQPVASKTASGAVSVDPRLVGWWEVQSIEMPQGKALKLIPGSPGQKVWFSESGHYNVLPNNDDTTSYRCVVAQPYGELDIWIKGLERLPSPCLYKVDDTVLKIAVAGRPLGFDQALKRPSAMRMDEEQNWALITMKRSAQPKK